MSLFVLILVGCSPSYDVVISDGTIYDGTGGASYKADIGIKNGYIKTIGAIKKTAEEISMQKDYTSLLDLLIFILIVKSVFKLIKGEMQRIF